MLDITALFTTNEEKLGLNSKQIADQLGISPTFYSFIKNGKRPLTTELIEKISIIFSLDDKTIKQLYVQTFISTNTIKINSDNPLFEQIINLLNQE